MSLLQDLIASARRQADDIEAANPEQPNESMHQRANRVVALERARQLRVWAEFAERGGEVGLKGGAA